MLSIRILIVCLILLVREMYSMPMDFGDSFPFLVNSDVKAQEVGGLPSEIVQLNEKTEHHDHTIHHRSKHHHGSRHRVHSRKHRRSLHAEKRSDGLLSFSDSNQIRRAKHLMLTKPYWPWP
ncbi:hypothetical protein M3Y96_00941500 [Aphelenchoides besseyi]|nr:hypothetical protein M3Y96_00941500 [Aphelenchoides besseyi]